MKTEQITLAAFIVIVSLSGQALIKASLNALPQSMAAGRGVSQFTPLLISPRFIGGIMLMCVSALSYIWLLRTTDFTRALPVMGAIVYLLVPVYGYVFLRETISPRQLAGLALLILSIFLMRK